MTRQCIVLVWLLGAETYVKPVLTAEARRLCLRRLANYFFLWDIGHAAFANFTLGAKLDRVLIAAALLPTKYVVRLTCKTSDVRVCAGGARLEPQLEGLSSRSIWIIWAAS